MKHFITTILIFNALIGFSQIGYEVVNNEKTIKLKDSDELQDHIKFFKRQNFKYAFELNKFYEPLFEQKLINHGLPLELKYLPILESKMDYRAVSKANAKGLWQIIPNTGYELGLLENECVSNFFDPLASTHYAVNYLKWLYDYTKDYNLTLAAYNYGIGNVMKIVKREKTKDFYKLKKFFPEETRNYIFRFHALVYLGETNYYGINKFSFPYNDIVAIPLKVQMTRDQLKKRFSNFDFLNPQLLCDILKENYLIYVNKKEL